MLFYYVQIKDRHDPRSKNQRKSKCSKRQQSWGLEGEEVWWSSDTLSRDFRGQSPLGKILGSKENLDWLKIDLNMTKIITAQDFKRTKNLCEWKYLYTAKSRAANMSQRYNDNILLAKSKSKSAGDLKNLHILQENSTEGLGPRRERCQGYVSIYENTPKTLLHLPPKS